MRKEYKNEAKLIKNKTALVIAHRLSTVRNVDKIYVIDKGLIYNEIAFSP